MANNVFQVKRTNVSGRTPNTTGSYGTNSQYIAAGEFALNMADGILYTSNGSAVIEIGANNTNQRITNSLTINNAKNLNFQTINTSAASYFTQQNDDNFVFYSTNTTYGARPIWGIFANSITSNLQVYVSLQLNSGLVANGSIGSPGQVLASNGSATYWTTTGGGSGTVTSVATGNGMTGGPITTTGTVSILANTGIVANSTGTFVDATYIGTLTANNTSFVGSVSAANVVSNAQLSGNLANYVTTTNLTNNLANYQTTAGLSANVATLTANNTSFVGSVSAANVVSNAQLSANLANYQTTAGLSANVATLTANNTSFVGSVSAANVVSNAQLSANLANYQTTAGLSANVATLTANNTSFVGSVSAANVVSNAQLSANLANYQTTAGLSANVATLTANNTSFVGTVSAANVVSNAQLSGNLANYAALAGATFTGAVVVSNNLTVTGNLTLSGNTVIVGANNLVVQDAIVSLHTPANLSALTSNDGKNIGLAFHYYDTEDKHALLYRDNSTGHLQYHNDGSDPLTNTNPTGNNLGVIQANSFWAGNDSVYATTNSTVYTGTANNTSFVGSVSAANVVSNAQLSANLANYQTTAGLSANVATLTANNSTNLNGQPASFYTNASNITTGTLPWAQAPTGTVNTSGNFTLSGNTTLAGTNTTISSNLNITGAFVNAVSYYSGTLLVANTTVINATHLAGVAGASYVQNTDSRTLSGNLVISGTSFTPSSNTILLGNSTQRWVLSANSGNFTGSITSSQGANAIILTNATSNWIWWPASAISAPTTSTRSVGTRLVLWPNLSGSTVDYAIGIDNGTLWQSVTSTSDQFRWYASTTNFMSANIAGLYHTGLVNAASFTTTGTTSNTSGVYPTSNTSGQTLGSATQRWVLSANTGTFSGNVAIGTTNTTAYALNVNGSFAAVTKSFVIDHPTKPDMKLRYASLEGPENGVYVRGKIEGKSIIELPEYWWNLIDQDTITVNLTPYGRSQDIWVQSTCAHFIHLNQQADCFFTVFAERKDVDKLVVEY